MTELDVLHAPVHTHKDLFNDEQVRAAQALTWVDDETLGRIPMANIAGQPLPETGASSSRSPHLGEHTREVLLELGYSDADVENLVQDGDVQCYAGQG